MCAASATASMPEQRRLVTVVFADVVGSTALAEELDPEDVRAIFTRYYAVANEVVTSHGGIVAKLLGDGVLACFGVPTSHGDDAQRALDAALALRDRASRDAALQRLKLRIGVNTGEVLTSDDGSGEIVGDAVNVAARVAAAAEEEEILAAEATHRAASAMTYGDARAIAAKGKSQPVRVWPLLGGREERAASTPFVGREDDLAQLEIVARRVLRERRPFLATITAGTGIGKSRLLGEFRRRLPEGVTFARAHCPPYGATLAYGPLRELLLDLVGVASDAPADDVRRQVGAALGADDDAVRDAQLITLSVAPEGSPEEQERELVFAAWRRLLRTSARQRPAIIAFEDLQHASETLLDLIEFVAQPADAAPILMVCLARPDLLQRRPAWGGGARNTLNLALEPLTDEDIGRVVAGLLEVQPPPAVLDLVIGRAAGSPFFAQELVRALMDHGPLDLHDAAAVERALQALPETVQATVLARIDMLPAGEREVLQAGAVIGRAFDASVLRAVSAVPPEALDATLGRLVERELLARAGDRFAFRSALVRDVAYGMLTRARRARDHAAIARTLEADAGERADELAGLIGIHYLEADKLTRASTVAIETSDRERESTRASAVRWLARASVANSNAGAWVEALGQVEAVVPLAADDEERMRLLVQLGETHYGGDPGWNALSEALRLWRASAVRDPALGARILTSVLMLALRSGISITPELLPREDEQMRMAEEALELAGETGNDLAVASATVPFTLLARSRSGRTPESMRHALDDVSRAAVILEASGEWTLWSVALDAWAALSGDLGDLRTGREVAARRLERAGVLGLERGHAHWTMPIYDLALGDPASALHHVSRALAEPAFADPSRTAPLALVGTLFLISLRAAANWALGRWDDVLRDAQDALPIARRLGDVPMRATFDHVGVAASYVARRRGLDDVLDEVSPILRASVGTEQSRAMVDDDPSHLDGVLAQVAGAGIDTWKFERSLSLLAAYGRVPSGPARLDGLVADAEGRGLRPLLAQLLRLRALHRRAPADAKRAFGILRECGMPADAALAGVEMAALGDRSELAAARAELERIGDERGLRAAEALG
jgi:class 3 adenylate cyclase